MKLQLRGGEWGRLLRCEGALGVVVGSASGKLYMAVSGGLDDGKGYTGRKEAEGKQCLR